MADIEQIDSMEKITKQLSPPAGSAPMQGYLLKRSETLRLWNQRWFTLNPTTGRMEYRIQRGDPRPRGLVFLEADSTIALSPLNFHGDKRYDGCCFYIGSSKKREYFLCAETPGAARAWVATLRAAAMVLKAHREAVNSLSGYDTGLQSNSVATAAAIASATARDSEKEVAAANRMSLLSSSSLLQKSLHFPIDLTSDAIDSLKEKLKEKENQIVNLFSELKARDNIIADFSLKLSETADAAEAAASAAKSISNERNTLRDSLEQLHKESNAKLQAVQQQCDVYKDREAAAQAEIQILRSELKKSSERIVNLESGLAVAEDLVKEAQAREAAAVASRLEALRQVETWRAEAFRTMKFVSAARTLASKIEDPVLQAELAEYSANQTKSPFSENNGESTDGEYRIQISSSACPADNTIQDSSESIQPDGSDALGALGSSDKSVVCDEVPLATTGITPNASAQGWLSNANEVPIMDNLPPSEATTDHRS